MVNNGGDIGKTLQQLGSEQSIKGLLTTMVTAGALDKLGNSATFKGQSGAAAAGPNSLSTAQTAATVGDKLLKNITNNVAGAAIDSAINGKPLDEKALSSALISALITTGLAAGANAIGDARMDTGLATACAGPNRRWHQTAPQPGENGGPTPGRIFAMLNVLWAAKNGHAYTHSHQS